MYKLFESLNIVDIKSCTARMNETKQTSFIEKSFSSLNPGWGGGTWVKFCWVCAAGFSEPLPHYSLFCGQL